MKHFLNGFTKTEAVATILPAVMVFAVLTVPVQSDNTDTSVPMEFDSIGAMLRDIDREKSLDSMTDFSATADNAEYGAIAYSDDQNCSGDDAEGSMDDVQAQLQIQLEALELVGHIELAEVAQEVENLELNEVDRSITVVDAALLAKVEAALMAAEAALQDIK